jgi:hypothetical protein
MNMKTLTAAIRATSVPLGRAVLLSLALAACGSSTPAPTEKLAVAEAAVQRANNAMTREHAAGELQIAISKLASAQDAANRREYLRAEQLAEQAEVDAHVAEMRAQAIRASVAARESQDANRALRQEIIR